MKNKNIRTGRDKNTANHLLNYIMQEQTLRNNKDFAYAYATGAFIAIIEAARMYGDDIQDVINRQCEVTAEEIEKLKLQKAA
jgi:hypothetical protein